MDSNTTNTLIGIGVILIAGLGAALVIRADIPPQKRQRLILDTPGCQAAKHLGLQTMALDSEICEIEETLSVGLVWITIGKVKIDSARVVAVQED